MTDGPVDAAFARYVCQVGMVTTAQVEQTRQAQADAAQQGILLSLADALVQLGFLTRVQRDNAEKTIKARQEGAELLGQYKLLERIGEGGMGTVYLAEDTAVGRMVAVKVLPKKHADRHEFLSRFRREAQATGKLNHPNIVTAYTVGEANGLHYYAMEYCDGETLDKVLTREGFLPWDKAAEVVMQVARGLKHAHAHSIIHRDIKPGNIFICRSPTADGTSTETQQLGLADTFVAKILDLGLSKNIGGEATSFYTQTGLALGTPHYVSPEQARGDKAIDGRTDIYSLGATFYHLVTGETPFQGPTPAMIMLKHISEQIANPQDIRDDIPDGVAHVIQKMMAKEPTDRYPDCQALLDDLELVSTGKMPSSQAVNAGRSSVAMPEHPAQLRRQGTGGPEAVGAVRQPAGRATRKHEPVEQAAERASTPEEAAARARAQKIMYAALGVAVLLLLLAIVLSGRSEPKTDVVAAKPDSAAFPVEPSGPTPPPTTHASSTKPAAPSPSAGLGQTPPSLVNNEIESVRNERAARLLEGANDWFKAHPQDPWGYRERLNALTSTYRSSPAGAEAAKIVAELALPEGELPPDSSVWHRGWEITRGAVQEMQDDFDGHKYVLATHPVAPGQPCILSRKWKVPDDKPILEFSVRAHDSGDFDLVAAVAGRTLLKEMMRGRTWRAFALDLSALKGQEADISLQHHNTAWINEHGWWQAPRFVESPSAGARVAPFDSAIAQAVPPEDAAWQNAVDMLALVDPGKDAVLGTWLLKPGEGLVSGMEQLARIEMPYQPPEEYDVRIVFTRRNSPRSECLVQVLAKSERQFEYVLGGWRNLVAGFETISGVRADSNFSNTHSEGILNTGQKYTSLVQVRNDGVKAYLDGKLVSQWLTDFSDMGVHAEWKLRDGGVAGVGTCESEFCFHSIQVLEVTGKGICRRGETKAAPVARAVETRTWRALFDGRTLDCLRGQGGGAWRVDNGALVAVPENRTAAQTQLEFEDGDVRVRFEVKDATYVQFTSRQGEEGGCTAQFDRSQLPGMYGKTHELVFTCRGDAVSATLDGQPAALESRGRPRKGRLQFYARDGALRVLSIEFAEADAARATPLLATDLAAKPAYLSDLDETEVKVGYGTFGKKGDLGFGGIRVQVVGVLSPNGIAMHAVTKGQAHVAYSLGRRFDTFRAGVALNDSSSACAPLIFRVVGDGKVLWESKPIAKFKEPQECTVAIDGVEKLELVVDCAGDYGNGHAVWIEPRVESQAAARAAAAAARAAQARLEYQKLAAEVYPLLAKNNIKAALARLTTAKADPNLEPMLATLERDVECAGYLEEVNKATEAGARLLADGRPYRFKKAGGNEVAVGRGTKSMVSGCQDGTIAIMQDLPGGKAAMKLDLDDLVPQARYELACLGMPPSPEGELKLAFASMLLLQHTAKTPPLPRAARAERSNEVRNRLDAAQDGQVASDKVGHVLACLERYERELDAEEAIAKADTVLKGKRYNDVSRAVRELRKDYLGTLALAKWLEARRDELNKILVAPGLLAKCYELKAMIPAASLSDATASYLRARALANIDVPSIDKLGELFSRKENIGIQFSGDVNVPQDGAYTFYTNSDDGSMLYIGETTVVSNDGTHGATEQSGTLTLKAGKHPFRVNYCQGIGGAAIVASWSGPGFGKQVIPASAFTHDPTEEEVVPEPDTAANATLPKAMALDLGSTLKLDVVLVPAGEFQMGSDVGEADEKPAHRVVITKPFFIGKCEVTVEQFKRFVDATGYVTDAERPGRKGYTLKDRKWQEVTGATWKTPGFTQRCPGKLERRTGLRRMSQQAVG
ncbi:MAG: protein kinase [Planctomycetota bacterium]|nr:protein kinase [Planctomycetota bacterium]